MITNRSGGPYPQLTFIVDGQLISRFFLLLQQGVRIKRRVGCSVAVFLREELGAAPDTIEKIQSIMLDGKPVDDIGSALLHDGSVLALSAAMPGLVGATLRRGGAYSSLRNAITYHEAGKACMPGEGWVSIKLFNLMMAELGPGLLRDGVLIKAPDLADLLSKWSPELLQGCSATLDGRRVDITMLEGNTALAGKGQVFLTVTGGPSDR
ncbi:MAG: hypothetical protein AABZ15_05205 [Nitrospirota bacterium]